MRILATLVLIAACAAGLGLYLGWFHLGTENGTDQTKVTLTVDKDKIEQDKDKAVEKAKDLEQNAKVKAAAVMDKSNRPTTQPAAH
jgi:hypothetical protein